MNRTRTPARIVLLFILVVLDCLLNWFPLMGSFFETMSARAHRNRADHQPLFFWCAGVIDWVALHVFGQPDHCKSQAEREDKYGGPWAAFMAAVRGEA